MSTILSRALQVYATTRQQSINIGLLYRVQTAVGDGSYTSEETIVLEKGFLTVLTDYEIKRLNEGGITITEGSRLSINRELIDIPSEVLYDWIDEYEFESRAAVLQYNISEGVSVFVLDTETMKKNE